MITVQDFQISKKLLTLPFDIVKINKEFIDEIEDPLNETLVLDTIHMLKALSKKILLEGIETEYRAQQFVELKCGNDNACDYLQGFYFSKPLPQSEFVKFLKK